MIEVLVIGFLIDFNFSAPLNAQLHDHFYIVPGYQVFIIVLFLSTTSIAFCRVLWSGFRKKEQLLSFLILNGLFLLFYLNVVIKLIYCFAFVKYGSVATLQMLESRPFQWISALSVVLLILEIFVILKFVKRIKAH